MTQALALLAALHLVPWLLAELGLARRRRRRRWLLALVPDGGRVLGLLRWRGREVLALREPDGSVGVRGPVSATAAAACGRWLEAEGFAAPGQDAVG